LEETLYQALDQSGAAWERQPILGRYVGDALLPEQAVVLEAAGYHWHRPRVAYDLERDAVLIGMGYTPMHFSEFDVGNPKGNTERVVRAWRDTIDAILRGEIAYRRPTLWPDDLVVGSKLRPVGDSAEIAVEVT
jgi:very-short-patch-repair endonuclease